MSAQGSAIKRRVSILFWFGMEHGSTRVLDAATTIALIQVLSIESFAQFIVFQSWVALMLLALPSFESALMRDHARHVHDGTLPREICHIRRSNQLKVGFGIFATIVFGVASPVALSFAERVSLAFLALAMPLAQAFYGSDRELLRYELRARTVTVLNAIQRMAVFGIVLVAALVTNSGPTRTFVVAGGASLAFIIFAVYWRVVVRLELPGLSRTISTECERTSLGSSLVHLNRTFFESVLWLHLGGALMAAIQTLDVYFLARQSISPVTIAAYGVALKAANFFQLLTLPFTQAFGVFLGRKQSDATSALRRLACIGVGITAVLGVFAVVLSAFAGPVLLELLSRGKFDSAQLAEASGYFTWMVAGVMLQALGFLPGTFVGSKGNVRAQVLWVYAPWFVFAILTYGYAAMMTEQPVLRAAQANVLVGGFYGLGHLFFFLFSGRKWRANKSSAGLV